MKSFENESDESVTSHLAKYMDIEDLSPFIFKDPNDTNNDPDIFLSSDDVRFLSGYFTFLTKHNISLDGLQLYFHSQKRGYYYRY